MVDKFKKGNDLSSIKLNILESFSLICTLSESKLLNQLSLIQLFLLFQNLGQLLKFQDSF